MSEHNYPNIKKLAQAFDWVLGLVASAIIGMFLLLIVIFTLFLNEV